MPTPADHSPPDVTPQASDLRVPDPTDCSPQNPGTLTYDERAILTLGDEGPVKD